VDLIQRDEGDAADPGPISDSDNDSTWDTAQDQDDERDQSDRSLDPTKLDLIGPDINIDPDNDPTDDTALTDLSDEDRSSDAISSSDLPESDIPDSPSESSSRIIGYYTSWAMYGRDYHVTDIPADLLTHINYAFLNISGDGLCVLGDPYADIDRYYDGDSWDTGALRGNFHQLQILKAAHPHLEILLSIGGWTWSTYFSDVALSPSSRSSFAESCVSLLRTYGFDGLDIDWEYPVGGGLETNHTRPEDKTNYTLLLNEIRLQLDDASAIDDRPYRLTIAAPAAPSVYVNLDLDLIHEALDWINIMTYDINGSWSTMTNFNAPLYASSTDPVPDEDSRLYLNTSAAAEAYLAAGIPPDKIVIGAPFYGRGWSGVPNINNGLYQSFTGLPTGTWETGIFDYHDIEDNYLPTYNRFFHDEAQVPWLYSPSTQTMISYDDPESMTHRVELIETLNLGGVMFWELSGDNEDYDLLSTLYEGLRL
jgi:chitinase